MIKVSGRDSFGYFVGLPMVSLGTALYAKSTMGTAVLGSLPYVLSGKFSFFTLGVWTYIIQAAVMLLMVFIVKRMYLKYIGAFLSSVVAGYMIDFFLFCLQGISAESFYARLLLYAAAYGMIVVGAGALMLTRLPIPPFDLFLREISLHKNISIRQVKVRLDISVLSLSLLLSFVLYGNLQGIGIGTFLAAVTNGPSIQWTHRQWQRILDGIPALEI